MCGIAPRHIAILCNNSWEGGRQYTPQQVGEMTLDQIFMLLAKVENLRADKEQIVVGSSLEATAIADKDGRIKGVAEDGTKIQGTVGGKSKLQRIKEESEARRKKEAEDLAAKEAAERKQQRRARRGK